MGPSSTVGSWWAWAQGTLAVRIPWPGRPFRPYGRRKPTPLAALGMRRRLPAGGGLSPRPPPARTISSIAAPTGLACASGDLRDTLPPLVTDTLAQALPVLDRKLHGFAAPDALMVGGGDPFLLSRSPASGQGVSVKPAGTLSLWGRGGLCRGHRLGSGGWSPGGGGGGPSPET